MKFDELIKQEAINFRKLIGFNYQPGRGLGAGDLDTLVKVIEQSTVLQELDLSWCNLTLHDDSYSLAKKGNIAKAIAKNTTIKVLNLSHNMISLQGVKNLAAAIKENETLTHVYIKGSNIRGDEQRSIFGVEGARSLADALVINESIYWLDIAFGSRFSDDSIVQSLVTSLTENLAKKKIINLRRVGLGYDDDGELGMVYNVIEHSTVLDDLDLSYNSLTLDDGKLADAIAQSNTIRKLDLSHNLINEEGMDELADALEVNETIQELYLNNNDNGADHKESKLHIESLAEALKENKSLKKLCLADNNIGIDDWEPVV